MDLNIAVCDDSFVDREYISKLVSLWGQKSGHYVHMDTFTSAENFLFNYSETYDFDMILLDIEMADMNGVELAKRIRRDNDSIQIIFITGYSDYISDGYDVSALHYLMKPVDDVKLFSVLDRAVLKLGKNDKVLVYEASGEVFRIPIYKIRYADVYGNYVSIHANIDLTIKMTLSNLFDGLDERFYRVGRSVIVNLTEISRVTKTEIKLRDGSSIAVPRGAYDGINRAIINMG